MELPAASDLSLSSKSGAAAVSINSMNACLNVLLSLHCAGPPCAAQP